MKKQFVILTLGAISTFSFISLVESDKQSKSLVSEPVESAEVIDASGFTTVSLPSTNPIVLPSPSIEAIKPKESTPSASPQPISTSEPNHKKLDESKLIYFQDQDEASAYEAQWKAKRNSQREEDK